MSTANKINQERELLHYFTTLHDISKLVDRTKTYLQGDYAPYEKLSNLNRFRREMEPLLNNMEIRLHAPRAPKSLQPHHYPEARGHKASPSLWVCGFSETTTKNDLFNLFQVLDPKLTMENVAHRGHYAFINFRDPRAAETANHRCWNLDGTILETNVRYPRS